MGAERGMDQLVIYVLFLSYDSAKQLHSVQGQYFILSPAGERKMFLFLTVNIIQIVDFLQSTHHLKLLLNVCFCSWSLVQQVVKRLEPLLDAEKQRLYSDFMYLFRHTSEKLAPR